MKKSFAYFSFIIFLLTSCQQEIFFPTDAPVNAVVEKLVSAIVITNSLQTEFDSIVFRYQSNKTIEVHYRQTGDSIKRTYYYDNAGRLTKLEDDKVLYYTNNNTAYSISFLYNSSGQLIKTFTEFKTVPAVPAFYNNIVSGNNKKIVVYDTSYVNPSYNLGWANRIIYNTLSTDNFLQYDSCISLNYLTGGRTTYVSDYTYDTKKNVTGVRQYLSGWPIIGMGKCSNNTG
jgi:hypothetical protein